MTRYLPLLLLPFLAACATTPAGYETAQRDDWEGVNRAIYDFNNAVDSAVLKPVALGYRAAVPAPARKGVGNALDNIDEPLSFVNALLQGKVKRAFRAVDRFVINTTYGGFGLTDRAAELGLEEQPEDFGQTLAVWGVGSGPFVMLPILGPSSVRDATGFALNQIAGPYNQFEDRALNLSFEERAPRIALNIVDQRAGLIETADPILANALDPYTTLKSSYIQARTAQINDNAAGRPGGAGGGAMMEEFEPFDFDEDGAPTGEPDEPDGPETPEEPQD